ncbi:uncharacterized protein Tco025E_03058 [Trypanosoma conorhini]|uniref:Uncharacterized protein n=1 Tax=Trypanosoma conorhini TaxID=83891 RepID=A0A3R7NIG2_9TRYP|nr:uncharacterized protein Tco025E_03058 [Trypanosoma conorhini]RNF22581.1 hypothetical protein Tco025E_03058 [Trypanosoma conorhini]
MASYYARLDNLFAAYAPEKRPLVASLLEKYGGREEEVLQSLVNKFGPEPAGAANGFQGEGNNYRERLVRFYAKYAPKKLVTVDAMLARFAGREEELFLALVQKHGPEPPTFCNNGVLRSGENIFDSQSEQSSSMSSVAVSRYNVHDPRWRLARIFMEHAPERLAIVDQMMKKYAGREEEMLARCVERYGPEPPPPDEQSPRSRLSRFIEHYVPRKASSAEAMLKKYDGRLETLFAVLVYKLGPEPPALVPTGGARKLTYRQRLILFYKLYARERLVNVDTVLQRYKGDEETMFRILVEKYGPEPSPDFEPDAPIAPDKDYRTRLTRLFTKYAPERVNSIPSILRKYRGSEADIIKALVEKLGPEPPFASSATSSVVVPVVKEAADPCRGVSPMTGELSVADGKGSQEVYQDFEKPGVWLKQLSLPLSTYRRYAVNRLGEDRLSELEMRFGIPRLLVNKDNGDDNTEKSWVGVKNLVTVARNYNAAQETEEFEESTLAESVSANFACFLLILETVEFPLPEDYLEGSIFYRYPFCTLLGDRDRFALQMCAALMDLKAKFETDTIFLLDAEESCRERIVRQMDSWKQRHCARLEDRESYIQRLLQRARELLPEFEEKEREEVITVEQIELKGKVLWFHEGLQMMMSNNGALLSPYVGRKRGHEKSMLVGGKYVESTSPPAVVPRGFQHLISPHPLRRQGREDFFLHSSQYSTTSAEEKANLPLEGKQKTRATVTVTTPAVHGRKPICQGATSAGNVSSPLEGSPPPRRPREVVGPIQDVLRFGETWPENRPAMQTGNRVELTGRDKWGPAREGRLSEVATPPCRDAREAILLGETPEVAADVVPPCQGDIGSGLGYCYVPFFFEREGGVRSDL